MARDERRAGRSELPRLLQAVLDDPDYRPVPQRELLHRAHVAGKDRPAARRLIRRWIDEGRLSRVRGGRLAAAPVSRTPGPTAARRSGPLLGVLQLRGARAQLLPCEAALGGAIDLPAAARAGAADGDVVRFELARSRRDATPSARVVESLGHLDDPATDTRVVIAAFGLADAFPQAVLEAAQRLPAAVSRGEAARRERFDDPAPVTIDGETARDFDDAVAVQALKGGGFRLFVHVADVAHFVAPGSALDEEALRRGTSVYFPDRVLPMFPEKLSTDLCSLRPGVDRLVQSAVLEIGPRGKLRAARFADGVIRSAARLSYTQVARALEGGEGSEGMPEGVLPMLRVADRLRAVLERARHARGSIDFDLPEPQILLDVEGVMTGIAVEPRNHAHRMIEEFMLLANEAVAGYLDRNGVGCLYRIHEPPAADKLEALAGFVEHFGLDLRSPGGAITPSEIQRLLECAEGRPEYRIVSQVALRSMKQARYAVENSGHFGLASPTYCHFTSPIRRYPDLVVHRQLRARRAGGRSGGPHTDPSWLAEVAVSCSDRERKAEAAERTLLSRKKVAFIAGREGQTFDGVVTGVTAFGLFVQLVENLAEGLVRVERLGEEWFEHDTQRMELRGSQSGKAFRIGDRIRVRVERVDRVLQRVDLEPLEAGATEGAGDGGRGGRRRGAGVLRRKRRPDRRGGRW